jgi:hypothetical protein
MTDTVLVTLKTDFTLSMQDVKSEFNLQAGEINEDFGVVPLSHPEDTDQLYVVTVTEDAADKMRNSENKMFQAIHSNPKIG